jgi:hypothetical protein
LPPIVLTSLSMSMEIGTPAPTTSVTLPPIIGPPGSVPTVPPVLPTTAPVVPTPLPTGPPPTLSPTGPPRTLSPTPPTLLPTSVPVSSPTPGTCPLLHCCEEDCCGPNSVYDKATGGCEEDVGNPGWSLPYSDDYEFGCVERTCCDETCCTPPMTVWDPTIKCCVGPSN